VSVLLEHLAKRDMQFGRLLDCLINWRFWDENPYFDMGEIKCQY
jgi:hypothetical protein